jgi:hypothetical protein
MKRTLSDDYVIAEELNDLSAGERIQAEALEGIEWHQLFAWWDDNWLEIQAVVGARVNTLSFEQLWAVIHFPEKVSYL